MNSANQNVGWFVWLEVKINELSMSIKSFLMILFIGFGLQTLSLIFFYMVGLIRFRNAEVNFGVMKIFFQEFPGVLFGERPENVLIRNYADIAFSSIFDDVYKMYMMSSPLLLLFIVIAYKYVGKQSTESFGTAQFLRGAKLISEEDQIRNTKKIDHNFKLGNIPIPKEVETSHMMVIGSAGSGKTQLLKPNIKRAVENTVFKNIIHDIKGDWTSELYLAPRGDLIFNPMDSRTLNWTIFNDIHDVMDLKNVCLWLIPELPGKDPFWQNSARMILESILLYMWQTEKTSNEILKDLLSMAPDELAEVIAGYGKGAEFAGKKDSFLTLQSQMAFIDFLEDGDFSIREWINSGGGGNIFLLNSEKTDAIMRPVLSLFVNFMASEILTLPDNLDRRIYFWLDEFTALQKLPKVIDLLKLGRSKGATVCLAYQDFQQLEKIYSKEDMRTVINNTASIAVLQLKEPTSAKFFADRFGKQEYRIKSNTTSMGVSSNRDGISLADQIRDDYIVKDSEILNLPSLTAYVMIKDIEGVTKTKIPVTKLPAPNVPFMPRSISKEAQIALLKRQQLAQAVEQNVISIDDDLEQSAAVEGTQNREAKREELEVADSENLDF